MEKLNFRLRYPCKYLQKIFVVKNKGQINIKKVYDSMLEEITSLLKQQGLFVPTLKKQSLIQTTKLF